MKYRLYAFEKLDVYKEILRFNVEIRKIIDSFPKSEEFILKSQLKRSVDSIGANLAEGTARTSNLDQAHFTNIAFGSALETIHHLNLAKELNFIEDEKFVAFRFALDKIINQLNALYKYQIKNSKSLKKKLKA